jgi:hypothetical protein
MIAALTLALVASADAPAPPPPPPELSPMEMFYEGYLTYDDDRGIGYLGRARKPLRPEELYRLLDRPDLVARVDERRGSRIYWYIGAGLSFAVGTFVGLKLWSGVPDLNSRACVFSAANYNACAEEYQWRQAWGGGSIVAGLAGAAVLAGLGWSLDLEPVSRGEAVRLVNDYNAALLRRAKSPGASLRLWLGGSGVFARATF